MKALKHSIGLRLTKALNVVLMTIPFSLEWFYYYSERTAKPLPIIGDIGIIAIFAFIYIVFARIYDAFLISQNRITEMVCSQLLSILFTDCIMFAIIWLTTYGFPNPLPLLIGFAAQVVLIVVWSFCSHKGYYKIHPPKSSIIVRDGECNLQSLFKMYGLEKKFRVKSVISADDCLSDLSALDKAEVVFIYGVHSHERNTIIKYCVANSICAYIMPRIGDIIMRGAEEVHMFHLPMLKVNRYFATPEYRFIKRLFDIVSASIVLVLASPIMLVTAIAIKVTDGGPVFYKQRRLTVNGKEFNVLKFRSMRVDAEKDGVARLSSGDKDDRITPVGRIIRKFRIDELPQLLNIIGGSMSVVGPRPERPEIASQYEDTLPEFRLRLQVKAGLTGYAQVYGKYNTTPYDKLQMDLMYIAKAGLVEDLSIIFATIKILFESESTEGVEAGQITAIGNREHGDGIKEKETEKEREEVTM